MKELNILCVGGDARYRYMCEHLAKRFKCRCLYPDSLPEGAAVICSPDQVNFRVDVLVLPMLTGVIHEEWGHILPCGRERLLLDKLIPLLSPDALVTGGVADEQTAAFFRSHGFELTDYFKRRDLAYKNSIPTAEGTLKLAMQERAETVFGSRVLITGFGCVAKACAKLFAAAGAHVTCAVRRREAAAEAEAAGYCAADTGGLATLARDCDILINTVPALLLTEAVLSALPPKAVVIDLASKPGGTDFEAADALGIRCIHALALPGKVAPMTAGRYIAETVENIISERGE